MYKTPVGIRTLQGAERRLFVESLAMIVDDLQLGDRSFGADAFDNLTRNQKLAVLHTVATSLLCEDQPAPELTAAIESAAALIFRHAGDMLRRELGEPDQAVTLLSWRELVLDACRESGIEDPEKALSATDDLAETWNVLMDCLEGRVLWDNDWEMDECLDADPDISRQMRSELGISDDYFVAVAPDPPDTEAERLLEELQALTADAR